MDKYRVSLTPEERNELKLLVAAGRTAARKLTHARILLLADGEDCLDEEIVAALGTSLRTVERVRQRFVEEGFDAALDPKPHPRLPHRLREKAKADVVTLAKSDPPKGRKRWTLRLLAGQLVELKFLEKISHESVRRVLKKTA